MNIISFSQRGRGSTTYSSYPIGHGSRGIYLVDSIDEMKEKRAMYECDFPHRFESWIVEEYLDGPEMGVELIMHRGECYFASVMEASKSPPPIFHGVGRFVPASLGNNEQLELIREAISTAKLLGLNNTVLDIDAKYIPGRGPVSTCYDI
jgi:biotin carboxylase